MDEQNRETPEACVFCGRYKVTCALSKVGFICKDCLAEFLEGVKASAARRKQREYLQQANGSIQ